MFFALIDKYSQVVKTSVNDKLQLRIDQDYHIKAENASKYPPVLQGTT